MMAVPGGRLNVPVQEGGVSACPALVVGAWKFGIFLHLFSCAGAAAVGLFE